jgi:ClpP class serine protease
MQSINFHDFLLDHKIKPILVHSGAHKVAGSPLAEFTDEDLKIMQALTDSYYKIFTDGVKQSRGERLLINNNTFSGLVWLGKEAKELGLIDELKDFDEMIALEYGTYPVHYLRHQNDMNFKQILHDAFKQLSTYSHLNKIGAYYGLFT